ncbi:MAG: glycosyl transferase [Prolixibacteraceae bacterium]|nr:glycosyl transferase [Burkholderiales bacterium]
MSQLSPVVFIGSGEASTLERKTLIYSIKKNTRVAPEIIVFNGTHNTIERENAAPQLAPMSLRAKYKNITEFSNYRFLIPELCGFAGRAIYLDSDMICIADLSDLFNASLADADLLGKSFVDKNGQRRWGLSAALYDCASCRFDLEGYMDEMDKGTYGYNDLQQMTSKFLASHPFRIGEIDPNWNSFDHFDSKTKLIHYTNLYTQPWKARGHPHGSVWFQYLQEAREAGFVTDADIDLAIRRGYVRQDLMKGNSIGLGGVVRNALSDLKASVRSR